MTPEAKARQTIDALLLAAGWHVCNVADANLHAGSSDVPTSSAHRRCGRRRWRSFFVTKDKANK